MKIGPVERRSGFVGDTGMFGVRTGNQKIAHIIHPGNAFRVGIITSVRAAPIIDHIIAEIERQTFQVFLMGIPVVITGPGITSPIVGIKIVMETRPGSAGSPNDRAVTALSWS